MSGTLHRRDEIMRIVRSKPVHSQDELLAELRKRGIRVTQPTLSRDLRELGLAKTQGGYVLPEDLALTPPLPFIPAAKREGRLEQAVREFVVHVALSGTIVVVKTPPAAAQPVAHAIDAADLEEVVGTLGGDDTIFVATTSAHAAEALSRRLSRLISPSRTRRTRA